ncbi:hypothetical protein D3C81_2049620 [compost metagenome]
MPHAERLAVALAARQEDRHADARLRLDMLDLQARQFITAKSSPETDQQQGLVTAGAQ